MSSSVGIILPNWMEKMFQTTNQAMISMVNFHFANGEVTVGIHRLCIQHTSTKVRRNYLEWNSKKSQQDMASLRIRDHQLILTIHLAVYHGLPAMGYIKWMPTLCWLVCNHKVHGLHRHNKLGGSPVEPTTEGSSKTGKNPIRIQWNSWDNSNMWDIIWWYWGDIVDILWTRYMSGEIVCGQHSATNLRITNSKPGWCFQPLWKILQ